MAPQWIKLCTRHEIQLQKIRCQCTDCQKKRCDCTDCEASRPTEPQNTPWATAVAAAVQHQQHVDTSIALSAYAGAGHGGGEGSSNFKCQCLDCQQVRRDQVVHARGRISLEYQNIQNKVQQYHQQQQQQKQQDMQDDIHRAVPEIRVRRVENNAQGRKGQWLPQCQVLNNQEQYYEVSIMQDQREEVPLGGSAETPILIPEEELQQNYNKQNNALPFEVLVNIFKYLPSIKVARKASEACRTWRDTFEANSYEICTTIAPKALLNAYTMVKISPTATESFDLHLQRVESRLETIVQLANIMHRSVPEDREPKSTLEDLVNSGSFLPGTTLEELCAGIYNSPPPAPPKPLEPEVDLKKMWAPIENLWQLRQDLRDAGYSIYRHGAASSTNPHLLQERLKSNYEHSDLVVMLQSFKGSYEHVRHQVMNRLWKWPGGIEGFYWDWDFPPKTNLSIIQRHQSMVDAIYQMVMLVEGPVFFSKILADPAPTGIVCKLLMRLALAAFQEFPGNDPDFWEWGFLGGHDPVAILQKVVEEGEEEERRRAGAI